MKLNLVGFACIVLFSLSACRTARPNAARKDDHKIDITFLQINDVYEIAPLSGGKEGGVARVATLKKKYKQKNPNTFLIIAGDFLSPSVYNSLQYQGKAIRGRQMVEALNSAGMDIAIFGNHEFDIKEAELQDRIDESKFGWVSSNAFHKQNTVVKPFAKSGNPLSEAFILDVQDADSTVASIGFFGLVLPFNKADYVSYTDALTAAKDMYALLSKSCDAVVAITHQSMEADELLAKELPGLTAIIGGHEHDGRYAKIGNVPITKAIANAKTAYIINLSINTKKKTHRVKTKIESINENVPLDSATNVVVEKWNHIADENYSSLGFDAKAVMINTGEGLEGTETAVRSRFTNLTRLIVAAEKEAAPQADIAVMNGGSIRVDDVLQPPVTQYDILRTMPFGGTISEADMKGSLVIRLLEAGRKNIGTGGFLHYSENVSFANDVWSVNGQHIDSGKTYRVALPEFVFSGKEANMDFVNANNADVVKVYPAAEKGDPKSDIRLAVVRYLEKHKSDYMK